MRWSEKDLFEVELFEPLPDETAARRPQLPGQVMPLPGEALASWLLRYAEPFGFAPEDLLPRTSEAELAGHGDWWRRPYPALIERLAQATGVDPMTIADMTLWSGDEATDDRCDRFSWLRFQASRPVNRQQRRMAVCPLCLAEDETPYVRRDWAVGWATICPDHAVVLMGDCPECGGKLRLPALSSRDRFAPDRCPRCAFRLGTASPRAAHGAVIDLHRRLAEGRAQRTFDLPGHGPLSWPVAMALFDVLLGTVWIDTKPGARSQLFARIAKDTGGDELGETPVGSYEGLRILAWFLAGWPDRMRIATAILRAPRPQRQLERWHDLGDGLRREVETLLLAAWPDKTADPDRAWWRGWIETLPETGDDLRNRADKERFPHRRARLLALADVRDGMPVELAADAAGILPRTLYAWLKRGAKGGLESALDRQRGALNQAQTIEIAQWIAEAPTNQPRWRSNRVKNEVLRRFGMEISLEVAARLLREHGPWVRRRISAPRRRATYAPAAK